MSDYADIADYLNSFYVGPNMLHSAIADFLSDQRSFSDILGSHDEFYESVKNSVIKKAYYSDQPHFRLIDKNRPDMTDRRDTNDDQNGFIEALVARARGLWAVMNSLGFEPGQEIIRMNCPALLYAAAAATPLKTFDSQALFDLKEFLLYAEMLWLSKQRFFETGESQ